MLMCRQDCSPKIQGTVLSDTFLNISHSTDWIKQPQGHAEPCCQLATVQRTKSAIMKGFWTGNVPCWTKLAPRPLPAHTWCYLTLCPLL